MYREIGRLGALGSDLTGRKYEWHILENFNDHSWSRTRSKPTRNFALCADIFRCDLNTVKEGGLSRPRKENHEEALHLV